MIPVVFIPGPVKKDQVANLRSITATVVKIKVFEISVVAARTCIGSVADDACGDARLSCAPADKICAPCVIRSSGMSLNLRAVPIAVFGIVA